MAIHPYQRFYGKLLLFGEYAIIHGAEGLAVPFERYHMDFALAKDQYTVRKSTLLLEKYLVYLSANFSPETYDIKGFEEDIKKGLCISSTIPIGYGLGSSGALVANFFHSYCLQKEKFSEISDLKKELGLLESFFHGASSGLDPLVSYLSDPVLIQQQDLCRIAAIPPTAAKNFKLFILNSNIERRTAPLVDIYKQKLSNDNSFAQMIQKDLLPLNNEIIQHYLSCNEDLGLKKIKELSVLQLTFFQEMIPDRIAQLWQDGLDAGTYTMKICGAGGGGFFMGFGDASQIHDYDIISLS
jgi:mevalonate kinase